MAAPDLHSLPLTNLVGLMSDPDGINGITGKLKGHRLTTAKQMFLYRSTNESEPEVVMHSGFIIIYDAKLYVASNESQDGYAKAPNPSPSNEESPSSYVILTILEKPTNVTIKSSKDLELSAGSSLPFSTSAGRLVHCGGEPPNGELKAQWKIYRKYSATLPVKWAVEEILVSPACACQASIRPPRQQGD